MTEIQLPSTNTPEVNLAKKVIVCRGRSCNKYGGKQVWENFKQNLPSEVELISVPCLGQCGNGAMVVVEPDKTWYWQVHPDEVVKIIQEHITGNSPIKIMLYPKFHS